MKRIKFLKAPTSFSNDSEFFAHISKIKGKEELLNNLRIALNFPDYFGFNWDALFDCLRDFHWIDKKGIVLVHDEMPILSDDDFKTYLEILNGAIQDWKKGEDHYFEVIFPEQSKHLVQKVLAGY